MKFPSWLGNIRRRRQGRAARRPARLFLECLEDRCVPSTIQGTLLNTGTNAGLSGWTVWLDVNRDRQLDPGDPVTTTDANGTYFFDTTNVPPALTNSNGSFDCVQLDLQVGTGGRWLSTTATDAVVNRTTTPSATANFGVSFQPTVGAGPVGPESPVNITPTAAPQGYPPSVLNVAVSADALGDYVAAWRQYTTGTIYARVFNADGSARTGEVAVGVSPANPSGPDLLEPKVAMAGNGRFAVAWRGSNGGFVQVYDLNGTPAAGPVTLVGAVEGAAADAQGDFVLLYDHVTASKSGKSTATLQVQRLTAGGVTNGSAISVATAGQSGNSSVGMDRAGNFVVAWDYAGVQAQRFNASGSKVGSQITVTSGGSWSAAAMNASGEFVVAYEIAGQRQAQIYNANGTPAGAAVTFSSTSEDNRPAGVALDGAGNVTFAWAVHLSNTVLDRNQVHIRQLPAGGALQPETLANTATQGTRQLASVAATGNGSFVVVWEGNGATDPAGIYSERFAPAPQVGAFSASASTVTGGSALTLTASNITDPNAGATITLVAFYATDSTGNQYLLGYGTQTSPGVWTLAFTVSLAPGHDTVFAEATDSLSVLGADSALLNLTVQ
jgi:hypothetical protein